MKVRLSRKLTNNDNDSNPQRKDHLGTVNNKLIENSRNVQGGIRLVGKIDEYHLISESIEFTGFIAPLEYFNVRLWGAYVYRTA